MTAPTADRATWDVGLVWRRGTRSVRLPRRVLTVAIGLTLACAVVAVAALGLGDYGLSPADVLAAVTGRSTDPLASYFVQELRLPRVVAALTVGAALGAAGCLFQTVTDNTLGSPDIIGFTTGAATGALVQIIVLGQDRGSPAVGALLGGAGTAVLVRVLVGRGLSGQRLVLVGLGVGASLSALNALLIVRASLATAQSAAFWLAGSLNAVLWPRTVLALVVVGLLLSAAMLLDRPVRRLALGDDVAAATGLDVTRTRGLAVAVAVGLVAVATATTGPISFIALAAPQVARRLSATPAPGVVESSLCGAFLVLSSDVLAQRLFAPTELAVGAVTGALGGIYLIGLLIVTWRRT